MYVLGQPAPATGLDVPQLPRQKKTILDRIADPFGYPLGVFVAYGVLLGAGAAAGVVGARALGLGRRRRR